MEDQDNMKIYLINNKRIKSQPVDAEIIPASIRKCDFPSGGVYVKVEDYECNTGTTWLRCWIIPSDGEKIILENYYKNSEYIWFITHQVGGYTIDKWHKLLEELRPIEDWIYQLRRDAKKTNAN
jgi:hypothetical protein